MTKPSRILVVDDDPGYRRLLGTVLEGAGHEVEMAADGAEAWERLKNRTRADVDTVLLDLVMPELDGLQLLGRIKKHPRLRMLPVILQTADSNRDQIEVGIAAGAYYYLTKPFDQSLLLSIVGTASREYAQHRSLLQEVQRGIDGLGALRSARFELRTLDEASNLATLLAYACPDPEATAIGLTELLVNAIEHGNLGITYREKSGLVMSGRWHEEVEQRLAAPELADRRVRVAFERNGTGIRIEISDDGNGFDWRPFLAIDPSRAFDNHGRGIAMAKMFSFTTLEYQGRGNVVVGTIAT